MLEPAPAAAFPSPFRLRALCCAQAAWSTYSVYAVMLQPTQQSGKRVMLVVLFALLSIIFHQAQALGDGRMRRVSITLGSFFGLCTVAGEALRNTDSVAQYTASLSAAVYGLLLAAGFASLYAALLQMVFARAMRWDFADRELKRRPARGRAASFWWCAVLIFVCWLPYLVLSFPGILSADSFWQLRQGLGNDALNTHHPVLHTLWMGAFAHLGVKLGAIDLGIALFSLFQMALMAICCAFALSYLARIGAHRGLRLALLLYFILPPMHGLYSVTLWKDVPFAGITLVLMPLLLETVRDPQRIFSSKARLLGLGVCVVLFCLLRNNGLYAFILFAPIWLAVCRRFWRPLLVLWMACFAAVALFHVGTSRLLHAEKGSVREMLSVPLQQIARVVRDHGAEVNADDSAMIAEILPLSAISEVYNPHLSDNVKERLDISTFEADPLRYASLWLRLGAQFPQAYLDALLCQNFGYWYPDVDYWVTGKHGSDYTAEPPHHFLSPWTYEPNETRLAAAQSFSGWLHGTLYRLPLLSMLTSPGFMAWVLAASIALCALKRRAAHALPMLLLACVWLTTLASPVFSEYRYVYSLMLCTPVCLGAVLAMPKADPESPSNASDT